MKAETVFNLASGAFVAFLLQLAFVLWKKLRRISKMARQNNEPISSYRVIQAVKAGNQNKK